MRQYTLRDGSTYHHGQQFSCALNGISYPANWLELATAEDLVTHGITVSEVPDPPPVEVGSSAAAAVAPPPAPVVQTIVQHVTAPPADDTQRMMDRAYREALFALDDDNPSADEYPMLSAMIGSTVPCTGELRVDFHAAAQFAIASEVQWSRAAAAEFRAKLSGR